jgi:hypothetical protein
MNTQLILFTLMNKEAKAVYEFQDMITSSEIVLQEIKNTKSPGIVLVTIDCDNDVMSKLKNLVYKESWRFSCLLKIAKVERTLPMENLQEGLLKLSKELREIIGTNTYRITLHRTRSQELRDVIVNQLASGINGTVRLTNYDCEIVIYLIDSKLYFVFPSSLNQISIEKIRYLPQF